ncbi:Rpa49 subunit specific to nuclear RNA polymerase I [Rickenella mellea]|uniref:Rpa49 subunit specific to nuclear RNA polymerase I n=1 Tax=Rickenella mellea TaxID=50990 RepID=A0A4Y7QGS2_9AGAM|nr:Rpa49 subunit specific to nuclear RNA polymerase I [Rickenella mellea]
MAGAVINKKRKRDEREDNSELVNLNLSDSKVSQVGPVLVSFPAIQPPNSTPFQCFRRPNAPADIAEREFSLQPLLVAGETDSVEFYSANESETATQGIKYFVAVHNKKTNKVIVRAAPMQVMTRRVKALKGVESAPVSNLERVQARNALGETFGSKKAVKAIRAAERNKVDVSAMKAVTGYLQESIGTNTAGLPTQEEAKAEADNNRLIPRYNGDATSPAEVYGLHDIIPETEFNAIPVSALLSAGSSRERLGLLPCSRSKWIEKHLNLVFSAPKPNKLDLKVLYYISAMLAFKFATFKLDDKQKLIDRMRGAPDVITEGLLSRFTETARGSSKAQVTSQTETMLLTNIFALCLRIDDFATDTSIIASDLSMAVPSVNQLFKSLGCKIETLGGADLKRLGLPDSAANTKRAVLRVPLTFPKPRSKKRRT